MFRIKGIFHPDRYRFCFQRFRRLRVNGLHTHIGQLIGDVVVGVAHRMGVFRADDQRVAGAEVVFLVNNRLGSAEQNGDLGKCHLRIAAVEFSHNAFRTFGVAGGETDGRERVDLVETVLDPLVDSQLPAVIPTAQVDIARIITEIFQDIGGIEGTVHLAERGQQLACRQQELGAGDIAGGKHVFHAAQNVDRQIDPVADEIVGIGQRESCRYQTFVHFDQAVPQSQHLAGIVLLILEQLVDPRLPVLLVLEQVVGHSGVGGYHINPAIDIIFIAQDDIFQYLLKTSH